MIRTLWRMLFAKTVPTAGQRWRLKNKDPFEPVIVTVLEVKQGWVKYAFASAMATAWTLPMREFLYNYRPETA